MDIVLDLYSFVQSSPWPERWLEEMTEALRIPEGTDFASTIWGRVLLTSARIEIEGMRDQLVRAVDIIRTGLGLEKYLPVYQEDLANINNLVMLLENSEKLNSKTVWDDLYFGINTFTFSILPRAGKEVDKSKQERVKDIRDDVKKRIKKFREQIVNANSAELTHDLNSLYARMKYLANLVIELSKKYTEKRIVNLYWILMI